MEAALLFLDECYQSHVLSPVLSPLGDIGLLPEIIDLVFEDI
jgi:hypothetical protein